MDRILVVNYGSQYNQVIVRRIRSLGVLSLLIDPKDLNVSKIDSSVKGIILSGGPNSVNDENYPSLDINILNLNIPILGICYGLQLLTKLFGGVVSASKVREFGKMEINIQSDSPLTKNVPHSFNVWMSHNDCVEVLPDSFFRLALSSNNKIAIIKHKTKEIYGVQFHPEVDNTDYGINILSNFVDITKANKDYTMPNFINQQVSIIKNMVGDSKIICALSGGIDSTVVGLLLNKAVPNNLIPIYIDHGLSRLGETEEVIKIYENLISTKLIVVDASQTFLSALKGVTEPEEKRHIIGKTFISEFKKATSQFSDVEYLAQGTLYTDIIESGNNNAKTIKSHHNVGGLPKELGLKLIEPLNTLFKDEVRLLGKELGLDEKMYNKQPFPGPGLSIRIIGEVNKETLDDLRFAHKILDDEITKANLNKSIWQYFIVFTPIKTVGVMGDDRTYGKVAVIRAVTSKDGMTADYYKFPYDVLDIISTRLVNEISSITRVVYDITSKPPSTIEWE
jgi:GMP synthase (glutamine-hydrolysing)